MLPTKGCDRSTDFNHTVDTFGTKPRSVTLSVMASALA